MTATIPNLWEGKFSKHTLAPVAVLRTHAGNFNAQSGGMLRAEVAYRFEEMEERRFRVITFSIVAPALPYRQDVLTAEHAEPGAYPVRVRSGFQNSPQPRDCHTQDELVEALGTISESPQLLSLIESLIAQINDDKGEDDAG